MLGIAHRKKKVVRRRAMERVWPSTTNVWRRRWKGTDKGAKWML